jgi:uncharacterized membrane protein YfcA
MQDGETSIISTVASHVDDDPALLKDRQWIYIMLVAFIYIAWIIYMNLSNHWDIFKEFWPISVTMAFGSFIAGATPQGGATVAFPVFTKLFQFPSGDARTFGLLIQAIGMTMASVLILIKRIPILPHVIGYSSLGGGVGVILGVFFFQIPAPFPKLLFTFVATAFGAALAFSRWGTDWSPLADVRNWNHYHRLVFVLIGFVGGAFAANTGAGTDMLAFIVLILAFGVDEKISTPTSVIIMGINSVIGAFMYIFVVQEVGIVWDYWLVAVPVVILGAPLGAYVCSKLKRDLLIISILVLITIELATTIWLIPFTPATMTFMIAALVISVIGFVAMLYYRQKILAVRLKRPFSS